MPSYMQVVNGHFSSVSTAEANIINTISSRGLTEIPAAHVLNNCSNLKFLAVNGDNGANTPLTDLSLYFSAMATGEGYSASGISSQGLCRIYNYNGTSDISKYGDMADYFMDDSGAGGKFSIGAMINVATSAHDQVIMGRWNDGVFKEYRLYINSSNELVMELYDNTAAKLVSAKTGALSGWNFVTATYDSTGGATAANGIKLYVGGALASVTRVNEALYVSMRDGDGLLTVGGSLSASATDATSLFASGMGLVFLEKSELSAATIYKICLNIRGYYGL